MNAQDQTSNFTLRVSRTLPAPRERVFAAWTEPEGHMKWWDTPMFTCVSSEADLRPEGRYCTSFSLKENDSIVTVAGVFQELVSSERLVYSWRWEDWEARAPNTLVTVDFRAQGDETDLVLIHEGFPDENMRDHHGEGWNITLDALEKGLGV